MKRSVFSALVAVVVLSSVQICNAQVQRHDGNWWQTLPETAKIFYVSGLQDGIILAGAFYVDPSGPCFEQNAKTFQEQYNKYAANVSVKQIVDGLDRFYNDHRNRRIRFNYAVSIVYASIAGELQDEIERKTQKARREAANDN